MAEDTGEFMLGRVAVTPVFLESNGVVDNNTENWNTAHINEVVGKLNEGFQWWQDLLATQSSVHSLEFVIDRTYVDNPAPTVYEPINRPSDAYALWSQEFLMRTGFDESTSLEQNMREFNNAQRLKANADWAFTVFVVNSEVEGEGTFAPGSFSRAFAFAGGLFFVVPSTRPASTFAHETGHMFWARDEYAGSASYFTQRGYYNTQNTNAVDNNPNLNFQQAPSIMAAGSSLTTAYDTMVSPASTLAMLGWQDSDGDGIFDILDVPLHLDGVGRVDVTTGSYRFVGQAKVQTLPNLNTSGLGNDITLNRISRIEAKIGNGSWQAVSQPDAYEVSLNLSIPLAGAQSGTILIRAIDDETGITSNIFQGEIGALPDATSTIGINGFAFNDANANGLFDAIESGIGAQTVRLVNAAGSPITLDRSVEPDTQVPGPFASTTFPGVTITSLGTDTNGNVGAFNDTGATTGSRVFRPYSTSRLGYADTWNDRRQLMVEFTSPTSFVSIDVIGTGVSSYGRLDAYDANDNLLERVTSAELLSGESQKLELGRDMAEIAYILVRGHMGSGVKLDNLRYGPRTQTTTDSFGRYSFNGLPAGPYNVQVVLSGVTSQVTSPGGATQTVNLQSQETLEHLNYGINFQNTAWHNTRIAEDVNNDGDVTAIDVLLIINLLNTITSSQLMGSTISSPPYVDVSNDAFLTALDALMVINAINGAGGNSGSGEGADDESRAPIGGDTLPQPDWQSGQDAGFLTEGEACAPYELPQNQVEIESESSRLAAELAVGVWLPSSPVAQEADGETAASAGCGCVASQLANQLASVSTPWNPDLESQGGTANSPADLFVRDRELIARLQSNPWTLPEPCHCADCLAVELAELRIG